MPRKYQDAFDKMFPDCITSEDKIRRIVNRCTKDELARVVLDTLVTMSQGTLLHHSALDGEETPHAPMWSSITDIVVNLGSGVPRPFTYTWIPGPESTREVRAEGYSEGYADGYADGVEDRP